MIVEVMLILLFFASRLFGVSLPYISSIIDSGVVFLMPIAVVSFVLYFILSIFYSRVFEIVLGIVLGGIILYYLFGYVL